MPDWTKEQRQVIDSRDQDLLVSAAAGSGKSAVLVQRILEKCLDPDNPVEIDRMLVVTFTNAAAASLREKIRSSLETEAAGEDPERAKIAMRQLSMLAGDHIETIDRFCREIVLDHANALEIDPSFRIADEGERSLLQSEAVSQVIEESLDEPSGELKSAFLDFSRLYAPGKTDKGLEELIISFYEFSMSHEFPRMWRHSCAELYRGDASSQEWMRDLLGSIRMRIKEIHESLEEGLLVCQSPGGPYHYTLAMTEHTALLERLTHCSSMKEYASCLTGFEWPRAGVKKRKADAPYVDAAKEKYVKDIRDRAKKGLNDLASRIFYASEEQIDQMRLDTARYMDALILLTDRFEERFSKEKEERGIADFSDVAHWALRVLIQVDEDQTPVVDEEGNYVRTRLAQEYMEYFREIFIDEYQDSNRVQEILLQSIAGPGSRFMVGDMKQSIYRFRMADTSIFLEKAESYSGKADAPQRRIDLHYNFRSRAVVLDAVNLVFRQIMRREIGGVEYTEEEELREGYPFPPDDVSKSVEAMPAGIQDADESEKDDQRGADADESRKSDPAKEEADKSKRIDLTGDESDMIPELLLVERADVPEASKNMEAEAAVVAQRILTMVGQTRIYRKESGKYEPVRFSDITILLRSMSGWAETFSRVLDEYGVPNRPDASTGYFDSPEVREVLAYLSVLDNPMQDIPLAASLRCVIGDVSDRELALIRAGRQEEPLYDSIAQYLKTGADPVIRRKLERFTDMTARLRAMVKDTPIHILLWKIYDETGYENRISAARGGRQKKANLELLVDKAISFEQTSYRGLFHFIRYIQKLRKAQKEDGQAADTTGGENLVRIMTMHKSKGLEFPVVFVCGLNKGFNLIDTRGTLVMHERLGAGLDYCDARRRGRMPNRIASAISARARTDSIGEELRVLYVAMTRAEQKLILTGCVDSRKKAIEKALAVRAGTGQKLPGSVISGAGGMLDWILAALSRHEAEQGFFDSARWEGPSFQESEVSDLPGRILVCTGEEVMAGSRKQVMKAHRRLADLITPDPEKIVNPDLHERLEYMLSTQYAWAEGRDHMPGKVSVSWLKQEAYADEMRRLDKEDDIDVMTLDEAVSKKEMMTPPGQPEIHAMESEIPVPEFMKEDLRAQGPSASDMGTAYHLVLASLDLEKDRTAQLIEARLETMLKCDKILKEEASGIRIDRIEAFLSSGLGERMRLSAAKRNLWREQPFVISRRADRINPEWSPEEMILIQGIIDAFFLEDDEVVLVDYKTDHAKAGDEESLAARYRVQFELYKEALESLLHRRVKETWLYSLSLGKAIPVNLPDGDTAKE